MKPYLVALSIPCALLLGCIDAREHDGHADRRGATLPNDAYYVGVPLPFRTVADCLAGGKLAAACTHEVALCASGAFGVRHGDSVTSGRYRLDDHHAVNKRHEHDDDNDLDERDGESASAPFDFDVEAGQLVTDPAAAGAIAWQPDVEGRWTTAVATVIDCSARR